MTRKNNQNASEKQAGARGVSRYGESEAQFWSRILAVFSVKQALVPMCFNTPIPRLRLRFILS